MAVADADYCFISVEVGAYDSSGDSNVFKNSKFGKLMESNKLNIPDLSVLSIDAEGLSMPFVPAGDEAFALSEHVLRPYPNKTLKADSHIPCRSPAVLKPDSHIPCRSPAVLKPDSHIPCRNHATNLPQPYLSPASDNKRPGTPRDSRKKPTAGRSITFSSHAVRMTSACRDHATNLPLKPYSWHGRGTAWYV